MSNQNSVIFCQGRVKFYDARKNQFGFIHVQNSETQTIKDDIFFKDSALRDPSANPSDGENIYCYAQKGKKGYFGKEVIKAGELTPSEALEYLTLLHTNDFSQLVSNIIDGVLDANFEVTSVLESAMDHYQSLDPKIWQFLFVYGDDNQKALLISYFSELKFSQKLNLSTAAEELFEPFISNISDLSSLETVELVNHLIEHDKLKYITDDLWIEFLKSQPSAGENIFYSLESDFKVDFTLKFFAWSVKDALDFIEYLETNEFKIEEDLLSALFQFNYDNFSFRSNTYGNYYSSYTQLVERVLNLNLSSDFITDFTQINLKFINQTSFGRALNLISEIQEAAEKNTEYVVSEFYSTVLKHFKSNLPATLVSLEEDTLIDNYWNLKGLGLAEDITEHISRPCAIKLYRLDDNIEIDFLQDYKYINKVDFEAQRNFIYNLSKTAKEDNGILFWTVINKLRELVLEPKNTSYDPSTIFILFLLIQLEHVDKLDNNALKANDVFEFVYKKLTDETLIENKLNGYFDNCHGRGFASKIDQDDYTINRTNKIPCTYCEGKLMTDRQTGQPAVDERTNSKKYWCRNSICLSPSRHEQTDTFSFSEILKNIGFTDSDYLVGFVNGWVNKINSYLDHLECRSCIKELVPKDVGSGYYRVSYFYCNNSDCDEYGEDNLVYITHCINSKCEELIDSRDSSQCKNNWYICVHCLGCCSTEKIQNRIEYYAQTNQLYDGPTQGHKELGKLFCPDCGELINSNNNNGIYEGMLNKFRRMKTNHPNVIRYGQRGNDNKYWFLLKKSLDTTFDDFDSKIKKLSEIGFNVADDYKHGNEVALISEKFSDSDIVCASCNFSINIRELYKEGDYYRAQAIEKWHDKIFN